jgi:hypothetical protein
MGWRENRHEKGGGIVSRHEAYETLETGRFRTEPGRSGACADVLYEPRRGMPGAAN